MPRCIDTFWLKKVPYQELCPHYILEVSNFDFRYIRLCDLDIPKEKGLNYLQTMATLIKLHSTASDLHLYCLPITLSGVSRLQWVCDGPQKCCIQSKMYRLYNVLKNEKSHFSI